jgi:hypothetical protein
VRGVDSRPGFAGLRAKISGPMNKTYPVDVVAQAIVDGIERRSRWVMVPGWLRALLFVRGPFSVLLDRAGRREVGEAEQRLAAEIERSGAAATTAPVGAGGAADNAAREARRASA